MGATPGWALQLATYFLLKTSFDPVVSELSSHTFYTGCEFEVAIGVVQSGSSQFQVVCRVMHDVCVKCESRVNV